MLQSIPVLLRNHISPARRTFISGIGCITIALSLTACGNSELEPVKVKDVRTNPDNKAETADKLQSAVVSKDLEQVKQLIAQRANPNTPLGPNEETAVHLAVRSGTPEILNFLLSKGGKSDAENKDKNTPLLLAIELGKMDCVKILVSSGAPVNDRGPKGIFPIHLAAQKNRMDILKFLVENGAETDKMDNRKRTVLFYAAEGADEETMRYVITLGPDIHQLDKTDNTALMVASEEGNIPAIKVLIGEGADVNNPKDSAGRTALILAKMKHKDEAVKKLIELGAKDE